MSDEPVRILFVFACWSSAARKPNASPGAASRSEALTGSTSSACFRKPGMPEQTHAQLHALGVDVDTKPYALSFEDTVAYLAGKASRYDIVVSCQNVADIYPALERMHLRPPLIEHGGLVSEALAGPKHFTSPMSASVARSGMRRRAGCRRRITRSKSRPWSTWRRSSAATERGAGRNSASGVTSP